MDKSLLIVLFIFLGASFTIGQDDFYYEDFVYLDDIKSVKFTLENNPIAFPVVQLNQSKKLHLGFDDLDEVDKRYTYRIIHCDMNWNPSELDEMEYLDGFNGEEIYDSYHSMHSKVDYIHYDLYLPNQYLKWTISGNYLLLISDEDGNPVITKRFLVVEPQVSILATLIKPRDVSNLHSHQSLQISINHDEYYIRDPLNEVKVTVLQNFKWLDAIINVAPKNEISNTLTFDTFDPFSFKALKEFRNFDTRSLLYTSRYVYSINTFEDKIDVLLKKEKKRTYSNFISETDIDGNYIIANKDSRYGSKAAEYVNVGFTLYSPLPFEDHAVYVVGRFSDWQLYDSNKMSYDESSASYRANILLKQGFYDYYYTLADEQGRFDLSALEGSWYETENSYYILVYLREFGSYHDKLIALYNIK